MKQSEYAQKLNFANSSMPVTTLRKLMGHADLNTTQRYVYTSDEQLADSYKKFA